jgi:hypothetical protein
MLYRHEKMCFERKKTSVEPIHATAILHIQCSPFRWFASTIQMYSRLCPWLLTWSDLEEHFNEDGDGYVMVRSRHPVGNPERKV